MAFAAEDAGDCCAVFVGEDAGDLWVCAAVMNNIVQEMRVNVSQDGQRWLQ